MLHAIIISIGDELILGQTVDRNAAWLSAKLAALGVEPVEHITLGDDRERIVAALRRASEIADVILVTGGLGPTDDDLTRHALAEVLGTELKLRETSLRQIERFFEKLGRPMRAQNTIQAMIPERAEPIENTCGTAPGLSVKVGRTKAFFMPGVPVEMRTMFDVATGPELERLIAEQGGPKCIVFARIIHTCGTGESNIAEMLGDLMRRGGNPLVNTTAAHGIVSIRIIARAENADAANKMIEPLEQKIRRCVGEFIFGTDGDTLPVVIGRILGERGQTLALAESCTGGMVGKMLTDIPGSSGFFQAGWVTYGNQAKIDFLNVDPALIEQHGAVSEPVARRMAANARTLAGADYALSITGIAGPDGGTPEKPVGLVHFALAHPGGLETSHIILPGDRERVRLRAVNFGLNFLMKLIRTS